MWCVSSDSEGQQSGVTSSAWLSACWGTVWPQGYTLHPSADPEHRARDEAWGRARAVVGVRYLRKFKAGLLASLWTGCDFVIFIPRHISGHNLGSVPRLCTLRFCQGCCLLDAFNKYAWIRWAAGTNPELKSDQSEMKEIYRCVWNMWGPKAGSTKARPCKFILRLRQRLRI